MQAEPGMQASAPSTQGVEAGRLEGQGQSECDVNLGNTRCCLKNQTKLEHGEASGGRSDQVSLKWFC